MRYLATAVLAAGLVAFVGCTPPDNTKAKVAAMNTSNIQRVANMYAGFQNNMGGRGPKDEAEFKKYFGDYAKDKLDAMGIDPNKVNEVFTSERDKKPFKVRYGVGGGRGSVDAVVFESEGVAGRKQVGYTGGKVDEVDESAAKSLMDGKKTGTSTQPGGARTIGTGAPMGAPTGPTKG